MLKKLSFLFIVVLYTFFILSCSNKSTNPLTSNQNEAPSLEVPGTMTVAKGKTVSFTVSAKDVKAIQFYEKPYVIFDAVTINVFNMPEGAIFTDNGNGAANFTWMPSDTIKPGKYTIIFVASDKQSPPMSDSEYVDIIVNE